MLTLEEWDALPVDEGLRLECSEGVLILKSAPQLDHQVAVLGLASQLQTQLPTWLVVPGIDVLLRALPLTVRAPDIVVANTGLLDENPARLQANDVHLAVEVISTCSRRTDRITKRSEYAEAGIGLYWVVDLAAGEITCHRDPEGEGYRTMEFFRGSVLVPGPGGDVRVDSAALGRG